MSDSNPVQLNRREEHVELKLADLVVQPPENPESPIDAYYASIDDLIRRTTAEHVSSDPLLLRLFLLETVSAAELYFRKLLAGMSAICSVSGELANRSTMMVGAASYYLPSERGLAVLEHASLSGSGEIAKYTRNLSGFAIPQHSSTATALAGFEQVCQLRHAIIHAQGHLWYRNACELGLATQRLSCISINLMALQACMAKTHSAVRSYNTFVGNSALTRWFSAGLITGTWRTDQALLDSFFSLFVSRRDAVLPNARVLHTEICRKFHISKTAT